MTEKVSVIIPSYNNEKYLQECLDSILNQDYPEKEIIVIDDSSSDNSVHILKEYASKNKDVKFYEANHVGPNAARKLGIEKSTGDYVMFVDSDDFLMAEAIRILVNKIKKYDVDVVRSEAVRYPSGKKVASLLDDEEKEKIINHDDIVELLSIGFKLTSLWAKLYKREVIVGSRAFEMGVNFGEDLLINMNVLGDLSKILVIPDVLYSYRDTIDGSLTHSYTREQVVKNIKDRFTVSSEMLKFIDKNIKDGELKEDAIYEQLKAIWEVVKRLKKINCYTKKDFLVDFGEFFTETQHFSIDMNSLKKHIMKKNLKEQLKNGRAVISIAEMNSCGIWRNFLINKRFGKILRRGK